MKAPVSWIRDYVDLPGEATTEDIAARLTALGLKLESLERPGAVISGPLMSAPARWMASSLSPSAVSRAARPSVLVPAGRST